MAFERKWAAVPPQAFTANGNQFGFLTVADVAGFKVKQSAYLVNTAGATLAVQIKKIISPTTIVVGLIDNKLSSWIPLDISSWTVASGAAIGAEEQDKNNIPEVDHYKAVYEADPTVADRVVLVDQYGNIYSDANPLPATFTGTISIGEIIVKGTNGNTIEPNPDGSINVIVEPIPAPNTQVVSVYNEIVAVPAGTTIQIVSYTVPPGDTAVFQRAAVSGENIARYDLYINGVIQDTVRTMFGGDLTQVFDFTSGNDSGYPLAANETISIKVLHNRPYTGNFNARLQVLVIS
jgi:hypothetical protein